LAVEQKSDLSPVDYVAAAGDKQKKGDGKMAF